MEECIFCKIEKGEVSSEKVYDGQDFFAIKDIEPKAPLHLLLIPKKHIESLEQVGESDKKLLGAMLLQVPKLAYKFGLSDRGYKLVINTGEEGGQFVQHLHFHMLGGRKLQELV